MLLLEIPLLGDHEYVLLAFELVPITIPLLFVTQVFVKGVPAFVLRVKPGFKVAELVTVHNALSVIEML